MLWWTLRQLRSKDEQTKERAKEKLIADQSVDALTSLLKDKDGSLRLWASYALGKIASSAAVEPLLAALNDRDFFVVKQVIWSLGEIQDSRVSEKLLQILENPQSLPVLAQPEPLLQRTMDSAMVGLRYEAAEALAKLKERRAAKPLLQLLSQEQDAKQISRGVKSLGRLADPSTVDFLCKLFDDARMVSIRPEIVEALVAVRDPRSISSILRYSIQNGDSNKIPELSSSLKGFGLAAEKALIDFILTESGLLESERIRALKLLDSIGWKPKTDRERAIHAILLKRWDDLRKMSSAAVQPLIAAIKWSGFNSDVPDILADFGGVEGLEALKSALHTSDERMRNAVALGLAKIGNDDAVNALRIYDRYQDVRNAIELAREKPRTIKTLRTALSLIERLAQAEKVDKEEFTSFLKQADHSLPYGPIVTFKRSSSEDGYRDLDESEYPEPGFCIYSEIPKLQENRDQYGVYSAELKEPYTSFWLLRSGRLLALKTVYSRQHAGRSSGSHHLQTEQTLIEVDEFLQDSKRVTEALKQTCRALVKIFQPVMTNVDRQLISSLHL